VPMAASTARTAAPIRIGAMDRRAGEGDGDMVSNLGGGRHRCQ
jgi:hypothetical protein